MRCVTVEFDGLSTWRECPTCEELLRRDSVRFSDGCGLHEYGCVDSALDIGQTPEMLLEEMNKNKQ